jgi:hypothetical protein
MPSSGRGVRKNTSKRVNRGKKQNNRREISSGVSLVGNPLMDVTCVVRMAAAPLFPARSKVMMLPYYTSFQVSSGAVAAGTFITSMNGLYDPLTTGGSQPMGFDQMMIFYEHYTVLKCKAVAVIRNQSTALCTDACLAVRADVTPITSIKTIMETGNSIAVKLGIGNGQGHVKELALEVDVAKFGGVDDILDNFDSRGTVAANPVEQSYLHISCWNSETVGTVNIWVELRLQYYAVFTEPRVITPSMLKYMKDLVALPTTDCKS